MSLSLLGAGPAPLLSGQVLSQQGCGDAVNLCHICRHRKHRGEAIPNSLDNARFLPLRGVSGSLTDDELQVFQYFGLSLWRQFVRLLDGDGQFQQCLIEFIVTATPQG